MEKRQEAALAPEQAASPEESNYEQGEEARCYGNRKTVAYSQAPFMVIGESEKS